MHWPYVRGKLLNPRGAALHASFTPEDIRVGKSAALLCHYVFVFNAPKWCMNTLVYRIDHLNPSVGGDAFVFARNDRFYVLAVDQCVEEMLALFVVFMAFVGHYRECGQ